MAVKNNLIQRAMTGILFVAVLIGTILAGSMYFTILFAIISALTIAEFTGLVNQTEGVKANRPMSILAGLFLFFSFAFLGIAPGNNEILIPYLFIMIYLFVSELYLKHKNPINNWAYTMLSQMYIALPFALLNVLAYHSTGEDEGTISYNAILPLSIFIFTWVNDTGAYCTGSLFGKHRLFERISPKKSWEGSIGGGVLALVAAFIMSQFFDFLNLYEWLGLALVVVIFGTFGDLTESLFKRTIGIKDSGNILPGHGGMLDRFDSTIMAVPAAVVYLYFIEMI